MCNVGGDTPPESRNFGEDEGNQGLMMELEGGHRNSVIKRRNPHRVWARLIRLDEYLGWREYATATNLRKRAPLTDNYISELLNNGDVSEIEDFDIDEDDFDLEPNILFALAAEEDCSSEEQDDKQDVIEDESSSIPESVVEPPGLSFHHQYLLDEQQGPQDKEGQFLFHLQHKIPSNLWKKFSWRAVSTLSTTRRRVWKQVPFEDGPHNYMPIPTKPVRRPVDYFRDYFDDDFIEKISHCTNLYICDLLAVSSSVQAPKLLNYLLYI
ncbi:hypothetical protein EVAR_8400_1 [Eumeta japonica]|uniref:Uncharacterized protein n=1 Tax=Eumeta variegata TaxID=151549 RepID=A0A4C1WE95_EUMVA|nr:hypothetical protein EVAR_8400_1 [Eumeta japonica]